MRKNIIIGILSIVLGLMAIISGFEAWIINGCREELDIREDVILLSNSDVRYLVDTNDSGFLTIQAHTDAEGKIIVYAYDARTGEPRDVEVCGGRTVYFTE